MDEQSLQTKWNPNSVVWIGIQILTVLALISLRLLLKVNMASNELDVLLLARQYADPSWMPKDWYLNQAPGYRLLFQTLLGPVVANWGFLAASIAGRLVCYALVATGLVLIGRQIGLHLLLLLLAVSLFLSPNHYRNIVLQLGLQSPDNIKLLADALMLLAIGLMLAGKKLGIGLPLPLLFLAISLFLRGDNGRTLTQGLAAGEWLAKGVEAKAVAYGLVLLAIGLMLQKRYRLMALIMGLATSFHVLVGGYAFASAIAWLLSRWKSRFPNLRMLIWLFVLYIAGSAFAIKPVLEQLLAPTPAGRLLPSYIYVFLVLPYHLNPLSWPSSWWVNPLLYLLILASSVGIIWLTRPKEPLSNKLSEQYIARIGLFEFTLITLIPFILGWIVAPFDSQGRLLQYYLFRFGDIMLPLNTCLLFACALQQTFTSRKSQWALLLVCFFLLSRSVIPQFDIFKSDARDLRQFPSDVQRVDFEWIDFCEWVRLNTPKDAFFVSPPEGLVEFSWMAERPSIANRILLPQNKGAIADWYERLRDLSGNFRGDDQKNLIGRLLKGYNLLTTAQARKIMEKYQAEYLVTRAEHRLDLPVAYRNHSYILYKKF